MIRCLIILALVIAADWPDSIRAQSPDFPRTVIDMTGSPVTIELRPALIGVVNGDPVAEWVLPIDDVQIIDPNGGAFSDPAAWYGIGLLIVSEYDAVIYPVLIESAELAGVPVFRTTPVTSLALWRDTAQKIGLAAGREADVLDLMLQLDRQQAAIWRIVGDQTPARVLVLTPEGYTFGQGAWITDLIGAAGGINVAAEAGFADYRQIADSTIRDLAPDVILLAPAWERAAFMQIAAYADLHAVQVGRVFRLPFSPTVAADPGVALWYLAWALHPRAMWARVFG